MEKKEARNVLTPQNTAAGLGINLSVQSNMSKQHTLKKRSLDQEQGNLFMGKMRYPRITAVFDCFVCSSSEGDVLPCTHDLQPPETLKKQSRWGKFQKWLRRKRSAWQRPGLQISHRQKSFRSRRVDCLHSLLPAKGGTGRARLKPWLLLKKYGQKSPWSHALEKSSNSFSLL